MIDGVLGLEPDAQPRAIAIYESLEPEIDALVSDDAFKEAIDQLDLESLEGQLGRFDEHVKEYNAFHARERRIWAMKLRRGDVSAAQAKRHEAAFRKEIPTGRKAYQNAFATADEVAESLETAGFDRVLREHLGRFTEKLQNPSHPFSETFFTYFRDRGCTEPMIKEFTSGFGKIDFDFFGHAEGGLGELRRLSKRGVEAQTEILDYTEEKGFSYLRGRCGPPTWAVTASQILAAAGISVSAWVIVAIIVALLVTLAVICALSAPGSWLRDKCRYLNFLLPIFRF